MVRGRSISIWHVPKRANLHQLIGAVNIIKKLDIDGKAWPQNSKFFNQKFAMWGFTRSRRSLSKNASETFEALMKYFGLIAIVDGKIQLTDCGKKLIKEHPIDEPKRKKRSLAETEVQMGINIHSKVLANQMMKLYLTNPTVKQYCSGISLFPFRETLSLLLDPKIQYLTQDEIGLFLFNMKCKTERNKVKKDILNFRSLKDSERTRRIKKYKTTPEGNLTLVQAPTATYWRQLCQNTGLCRSENQILKINDGKEIEIRKLLCSYSDNEFDFQENELLWAKYFENSTINSTPISVFINVVGDTNGILIIKQREFIDNKPISEKVNNSLIPLTVFPNRKCNIEFIDVQTEKTVRMIELTFTKPSERKVVKIKSTSQRKYDNYDDKILDLIQSKDYDDFYKHLINVISERTGINYELHKASLRGGRLEYLFYMHLKKLESLNKISDVRWNGKSDQDGLARPAPGTNKGLPDITFRCGQYQFLLELTTIKGPTEQWKAEGVSVPWHIRNFKAQSKTKQVIGIFSPPITHEKVHDSMKSSKLPEHYDVLYVSIEKLLQLLSTNKLCTKLSKLALQPNFITS